MQSTAIAHIKTLEDIVEARDKALDLHIHAYKTMQKSQDVCNQMGNYLYPLAFNSSLKCPDEFRKELDRRFWRHAINKTGFNKYMDKVARNDFDISLEKNPPEFTMDNIRETLISSYHNAEHFFNRGLVNLFKRLEGKYKTNDAFKVSKKIILTNWFVCSYGELMLNHYNEGEINDLDRIIKTLDGKEFKEHGFSYELRQARNNKEYENEYLKIKMFKNGNCHLWFKRMDILDRINEIIAAWYGEGKLGS